MSEQEKREKVINGIESLRGRLLDAAKRDSIAMLDAIIVSDALVLLKAQEEEINGLRQLVEWAVDCDFGYDNIPEYYGMYKDKIGDMGYTEGLVYIAKEVAKHG